VTLICTPLVINKLHVGVMILVLEYGESEKELLPNENNKMFFVNRNNIKLQIIYRTIPPHINWYNDMLGR
jgi:hypothetical protein